MLERIERLCMLKLDDKERKILEKEIDEILKAFEKIDELEVEEELIIHAIEIKNIFREDLPSKFCMTSYLESLEKEDDFIIGPKTVIKDDI